MEAKGNDSPDSRLIQDWLLGPSALGAPGAVRHMVLEMGSIEVDPAGRVEHFREVALALPNVNNPISFKGEIVASIVPGGGMPILGAENVVQVRWEEERKCLSIGLKAKEGQNPFLPKGSILTMYCDPGSRTARTFAAMRTLVLAKWVLLDQPRKELAVARGAGGLASWQNAAASLNLLSNIASGYSARFLRVGPLPDDVAIGEQPLFSIEVGRRTGAALVDALAGQLRVNHLIAWNFAHLVNKYQGALASEGTFPFSLTTDYCPSRPVFPPLILELRSDHTLETYYDRWIFPETDPSRSVTPLPNPPNPRFGIRFESGLDTMNIRKDGWTIEYLVRQDWHDARLTVGDRSEPPRTGENLSFRISAVQSRDTSVAPLTLLRQPTLLSINSRTVLAQAFAAECPSEIVDKLAKAVEASEILTELREAANGRWLPTGVIKCEVLADAEELMEFQLLADRVSLLLSERCTLGCQVIVECVAGEASAAKAR